MTRVIPPFGLRMRPELKQAIENAAKYNKRSVNAEINYRLEMSVFGTSEPGTNLVANFREKVNELYRLADVISKTLEQDAISFEDALIELRRMGEGKIQ